MPACLNHPTVEATQACAGCHQPFCNDCLVELQGQRFCGACKNMRVRDLTVRVENYKLPQEALTMAIVGYLCAGIILWPMAFFKARRAIREIDENPSLPGREKAVAAQWVSGVGLVLVAGWVALNLVVSLTHNAGVR